jgi:autotransporter-associated beta strand protein
MKSLARNLSALTFLFASGHGTADVIYSNLKDIAIPATYDGVFVDVDGGHAPSSATFTGWDFNPYMGGVYVANSSAFQPGRTAANDMGTLMNSTVDQTIDGSLLLGTGMGGSIDHLGNTFAAGTPGTIGFKLNGSNYGWMRVVFTNNTGGAIIKDWAYDTSGAAIATGNVLQNGSTVTLNSALGSFTLGSPVGGSNNVVKTGANTASLTGANSHSGATTVAQGTLLVNGSVTGGGTVSVDGGATLGGTGSIAGPVIVNGVLSPGASIESLSTGALTFNDGSTFDCEMDSGAAAAVVADFQKVFGNLALTGTVTLDLTDVADAPTAIAPLTTLSLINYTGTWNGGFFTCGTNELANGEVFSAGLNTWQIHYDAIDGGMNFASENTAGHFVNLTAVPEPGSWLALSGLLGSGVLLRRRR